MRLSITSLLSVTLLTAAAAAQSPAIFPPDYGSVADGPFSSPNLPLANGTSRVQFVYDAASITVPSGHQITKVGFREDGGITTLNNGRSLQLEILMGYTTFSSSNLTSTFDNNWAATPTTVFPAGLYTLPHLHDPASPLTNGRFDISVVAVSLKNAPGQNLLIEYRIFGTSGGGAAFTYYLDRADFVSPVVDGPAGCPHTSGTAVQSVTPVRPGQYYSSTVNTAPAASPCLLALNIGTPMVTPFPLNIVFGGVSPTCLGEVSPVGLITLGGTTGGSGYVNWSFFIPNSLQFSNLVISSQGLFLDFFSPGGLVVSNGSQVTTGTNPRATALYVNGPPTTSPTGSLAPNYCPVTFFTYN